MKELLLSLFLLIITQGWIWMNYVVNIRKEKATNKKGFLTVEKYLAISVSSFWVVVGLWYIATH